MHRWRVIDFAQIHELKLRVTPAQCKSLGRPAWSRRSYKHGRSQKFVFRALL